MIDWLFTFLVIAYCFFIIYLWLGWERIPILIKDSSKSTVTIIIPIRNEAENICKLIDDLLNQTYTGDFDVLIIDDHSEDEPNKLLDPIIANTPSIKVLSLAGAEGKKAAIARGVELSNSEIILTTDGDCRVPKTWVEAMVNSFNRNCYLVSGPVKFTKSSKLFNQLQSIEFTSLIGSGAALVGWGKPIMANGANLGFKRQIFLDVKGFQGNEDTASGDDVFLLLKIANAYPNSIAFAKNDAAIVETKAKSSINSFFKQRIRWASKWKVYTDTFTKFTAVLVFLVSLLFVLLPILVVFQKVWLFVWINLLVVKAFFDYFFIRQVSKFMDEKKNVLAFILLQFLYPLYVVLTALLSLQTTYYWKGRKVK